MFLPDPRAAYERALVAAGVLLASTILLGGALLMEGGLGLVGCELCVLQRWPHGLACLAAAAALGVAHSRPAAYAGLMWTASAILAGGAVLAAYHSGVEAGAWPGPSSCTGHGLAPGGDVGSLVEALRSVRVARCDVAAIRFAGLSLANLNLIASLALSGIAAASTRPSARSKMLVAAGVVGAR